MVSSALIRTLTSRSRLALPLAGVGLLVAACGSSTTAKSASPSQPSTPPASSAPSAVTVETHVGPLGTYLTDGSGRTLYMFASDTSTSSTCSGSCASAWPPVISSGSPSVSGGAVSASLTTITRSDGTKQLSYGGHPLYYYVADTSAGDVLGEGSDGFGAKWWVLAPSGQPIESAAGSGASSTSPSSSASSTASTTSGGGGGWS